VDTVYDTPNGLTVFRQAIATVISDLVVDLNAEANESERTEAGFDYKNLLKSPNQARGLAEAVISSHFKLVDRNRVPGFGAEWTAGLRSVTTV
jgi:hypothetical protein